MNRLSLPQILQALEPSLEDVMRFHPNADMIAPEGFRLRGSMCGFASRVLQESLKKCGHGTELKIGIPADDFGILPNRMRRHVLLKSPEAAIDPTGTQWLALVGVDPHMAAKYAEIAALYPTGKVVCIRAGQERVYGERFAEYALGAGHRMNKIRRAIGATAGQESWPTDDVRAWMSKTEAYELLADIWNPERYEPFDHENDSETAVREAVSHIEEQIVSGLSV